MRQKKSNMFVRFITLFLLTGIVLTGCGASEEGTHTTYTREELQNTAKLELYEAESGELLKTIENEETLYRYVQAATFSDDAFEAERENELKETAENAGEAYCLVVYKYPAARYGDKEPEESYRTVLYRDVNIAKLIVGENSVKNMPLPEELLTFYYEMPEEEQTFYESLLPEE